MELITPTPTRTPPARPTPPTPAVPARVQAGLGLGKMVVDGSHLTLHVLINPVYNVVLGVNPALVSTVVFVQRIWDALLDPLVGQFSDNFRSRWGRRIPLLAGASFPLALAFGALWWFPRQAGEGWLVGHLLVVSLLFYAAHSLFAMPLLALLLETAENDNARIRLSGLFQACGFGIQIAAQWLFPLTQLPLFSDSVTGLRWVAAGAAAFFLAAGLCPVFLCRERGYIRVAARQPRMPLSASLRAAAGNPPFFTLLAARTVHSFTYNIVSFLAFYMNVYYVFGGEVRKAGLALGVVGSSYHIAAALGSLLIFPPLVRRYGTRRVFQLAAGILIVNGLSKLLLYQPGHPWLQLIVISANGLSASGIGLASIAILGEVVQQEERRTGLRREGLYASVLSWAEKAGMSLGALFGGLLLVWIGFEAGCGAQSPSTLALMKLSYALVPMLGAAAAMYLIRTYPGLEVTAPDGRRK